MKDIEEIKKNKLLIIMKSIFGENGKFQDNKIDSDIVFAFLKGIKSSDIFSLNLHKDPYFGIFSHFDVKDINSYVKKCESLGLVFIDEDKKFLATNKGIHFLNTGNIVDNFFYNSKEKKLTEDEYNIFSLNKEFFGNMNESQIKAVISANKDIMCIAGAGTGKTTVLTKRISWLVKKKDVNPEKILAITFSRRAKLNMMMKLENHNIKNVKVETFNSFSEKILRKNSNRIYNKKNRMLLYSEKPSIVLQCMKSLNMDVEKIIKDYFGSEEFRKNRKRLFGRFVKECFEIRDYFCNNLKCVEPFYKNIKSDIENAKVMYRIVNYINAYMKKNGLRDFSDQIKDALDFIKEKNYLKFFFEHVLVDEFQDINEIQYELVNALEPNNLFCVGDPRQSIYGWRGSKIKFIQNYHEDKIIYLTKNYRSSEDIVDIGNKVIKPMNLPDLISENDIKGIVDFKKFNNIEEEAFNISKCIKSEFINSDKSIYVIARTNKVLELVSEYLSRLNVLHKIQDDNRQEEGEDFIHLMTAHASKGTEADIVFAVGCSAGMYPCRKPEHKIMEYIKEYYDKNEEERRLLYVTLTRAKEKLVISYYGKNPSKFIKDIVRSQKNKNLNSEIVKIKNNSELKNKLIEFRKKKSNDLGLPENIILNDKDIDKIVSSGNADLVLKGNKRRYYDEIKSML
ncbi:MAG: UvrD-helicase domain-containing protein [Nanobdellota archaeon]